MNVLSLFDGIGGARVALDSASIKVRAYHSCEIDKRASAVVHRHYPDVVEHGDVVDVLRRLKALGQAQAQRYFGDAQIDLVVFGSPCQDMSVANRKRKGVEQGERSSLFFVAADIVDIVRPHHVLMENVASMSASCKEIITQRLGLEPVYIDSKQLCALIRPRLYWCSWPLRIDTLPAESAQYLCDILEPYTQTGARGCYISDAGLEMLKRIDERARQRGNGWRARVLGVEQKMCNLDAHYGSGPDGKRGIVYDPCSNRARMVTPREAERLQGFPDDYTAVCQDARTVRYKMLGNSFTVPVIAWILRQLPMNEQSQCE
jgi:site-specific DNA-cytosine methylase